MAVRTTSELVAGIIEVQASISLTPFIATASELVDDVAASSSAPDATRLELIERWLSAHFYAQRDPRAASEKAGSVAASYQSKVDLGLNNTHYGQMAITLDPTGMLKSASKGKRVARMSWVGKEEDRGEAEGT